MIELKNASIRRDGRMLFSEVSLQIHPNWKIGLTGKMVQENPVFLPCYWVN